MRLSVIQKKSINNGQTVSIKESSIVPVFYYCTLPVVSSWTLVLKA